jgi:preprotein translocase subunit SecA
LRLQMGFMEDLLMGADATKRDADNQKYLAELQQRVDRINALESSIEDLDDDELEGKTMEFRQRLQNGEDINGPLLEEAFAVVREAAW